MILEIADIRIHPGQQVGFEAAIKQGMATVLPGPRASFGPRCMEALRRRSAMCLQIEWGVSRGAHNVGFPWWAAVCGVARLDRQLLCAAAARGALQHLVT